MQRVVQSAHSAHSGYGCQNSFRLEPIVRQVIDIFKKSY